MGILIRLKTTVITALLLGALAPALLLPSLGRAAGEDHGRAKAAASIERDVIAQDTIGRDILGKPVSVKGILSGLYILFLGFVGIAALFALVMGGVLWMFSSTLTSTDKARRWIENAVWGLALAAASFLLLNTINPDLVGGFDLETILRDAVKRTAQPPGGGN